MPDIKLIHKNSVLDDSIMSYVNWDVVIKDREYKIYDIDGYIHSIGGRWGNNSYWACPRNEEPSVNNLIPFSGEPCAWGILIEPANYIKHSGLNGTSLERGCSCVITRNGKPFYSVGARDMDYAWAKAYSLLISDILEGPINFNCYDYQHKEILGRHIWWKRKPYTIGWYFDSDCCVLIYPGHISLEECYKKLHEMDSEETIKVDLLADKHIGYFCEDY